MNFGMKSSLVMFSNLRTISVLKLYLVLSRDDVQKRKLSRHRVLSTLVVHSNFETHFKRYVQFG